MIVINRTNEINYKILKSNFFPDSKHSKINFPRELLVYLLFDLLGLFVTTTGRIEASPKILLSFFVTNLQVKPS